MDLILHPGHGKCGSTSIQKFLHKNRAILEVNGFAIPDDCFRFRFEDKCDFSVAQSCVRYISEIINKGDYDRFERRIETVIRRAEQARIHTIIISAENLCNLQSERLHRIFSQAFHVRKVLYYIRRQDDFLLSAWQQWGHKSGLSLIEYCRRQVKSNHPPYWLQAAMLSSNYGDNVLEVVPFARETFYRGDLISDFLNTLGLNALFDPASASIEENKSLNPLVCEVLAQCPSIYQGPHDNQPKKALQKYASAEPWLFDPRKDYLDKTERRLILNHFEAENRRLHARYFPKVSFDLLFSIDAVQEAEPLAQRTESLEKQQLEFLDDWIRSWLRSKKIRTVIRSNARMLQAAKRRLFSSR